MLAKLLLLTFLVNGCLSACPDFETFSSLDLVQFSGNWQIQGMIRSLGSDPNMQCLQVDFISNNWSVAPVTVDTTLNGVYTQTGATFSQKVPTTIDSLSSRATWNMNINGTQSVYSVLDTDYSTYSLSVTCATVNGVDDLVAFFKTRSHDPIPSNIVDNYKTYLRSYGINTDLYFDIVHGHACH